MYKLLIADDEPWLRKRLMLTIDWEKLGISELFEAEDGAAAFALAIAHEPDIIITDIEMPELSGIDLMKTLNESALFPQIILISGYNEFEYARSAVRFGAVDYLLKPIGEDDLKRAVSKCIASLEKNRYNQQVLDLLSSSSDLLREKIYIDLLLGKLDFNKVSELHLNELGIVFPTGSMMCIIAHISPMQHTLSESVVEETLVAFSISKIIKNQLSSCFEKVLDFWVDEVNVYLVFSDLATDEFTAAAASALRTAKKMIKSLHAIRIAYGIGSVIDKLSDLCQSYQKARYNINLCRSGQTDADVIDEHANSFQIIYEEYNLKSLIASIRKREAEKSAGLLTDLISDFLNQSGGAPTALQIQLLYLNVLNSLFKGCLPFLPASEEVIQICLDYINKAAIFHTTDKMHVQLQNLLSVLIEQYQSFFSYKRHWLIDKMIAYINENYASPLSMSDVAAAFYLNASYFCKLFKDETGITFTNYLMRVRVDNAKRLLADNSMKLYDVASAVGYTNVQYFSTVFKDLEGMTPSQYRSGAAAQASGPVRCR